jgi:dienelactone hydrolase
LISLHRFAAAVMVLAMLPGCAPSRADLKPVLSVTDTGTIWFPSGDTVLSGDLKLPGGLGPFPAVVLMHGCGGIGNAERGWVDPLRQAGYATFVIDSFGGRGLTEVCTGRQTLSPTARIPDAYGALRILATHPKIDGRRIALMGFSHGGSVTLRSATVWARGRYAAADGPTFRAFLPFYPSCNVSFPELDRLSGPLRIHSGALDDWTPAAPCQRLVARLGGLGQDAQIVVYDGAHHSFDNIGRAVTRRTDVNNGSACSFTLSSITGAPPPAAAVAACVGRGATVGWNPEATEQARKNVLSQLAALLR